MKINNEVLLHIVNSLQDEIENSAISKIYNLNNSKYLFKLSNKKSLLISINDNYINLTNKSYTFPTTPSNFTMLLRKYLTNFKIININTINNDRIVVFKLVGLNDLKDDTTIYLVLELFGRYSNIAILNDEKFIISALKLINNDKRLILPNIKYDYELIQSVNDNIKQDLNLLENDYNLNDNRSKDLTDNLESILKKKAKKLEIKLDKLNNDYSSNINYDKYKNYGDLILTYGYNNKDNNILICNDYENNLIEIPIKKELSVSDNANAYYKKYSKMKRSLTQINNQIEITKQEINNIDELLFQIKICNDEELIEIHNQYNNIRVKKPKPSTIHTISTDNYIIYVGKNSVQNNEITFNLSRKDDLWFHVHQYPGAHVLLKSDEITDELINYCASIAAYYSKAKEAGKVVVMYTNIKNVKKGKQLGQVNILNEPSYITVTPKSID